MKTPNLETDRLLLRPFETADAQEVFECWESDPEVAKYMFWISHNDITRTQEWIKSEVGQIEKDIPYECNKGTVMREGKLHRLYL